MFQNKNSHRLLVGTCTIRFVKCSESMFSYSVCAFTEQQNKYECVWLSLDEQEGITVIKRCPGKFYIKKIGAC